MDCPKHPRFQYEKIRWITDVPCGYQNRRYNPTGKMFSNYYYFAQTQNGRPLSHPGQGWQTIYNSR